MSSKNCDMSKLRTRTNVHPYALHKYDACHLDNVLVIRESQTKAYLALLDTLELQHFFEIDVCCRLADKCLIAMVFVYLTRAKLSVSEYTPLNFFTALYLAHDMEEDEEDWKCEIIPIALGERYKEDFSIIINGKDEMWKAMDYRAVVSHKACLEVMSSFPSHAVWERNRPLAHSGASPRSKNGENHKGVGMTCSFCGDEEKYYDSDVQERVFSFIDDDGDECLTVYWFSSDADSDSNPEE